MYVYMYDILRAINDKDEGRCRHNVEHDMSTVHADIPLYKSTVSTSTLGILTNSSKCQQLAL